MHSFRCPPPTYSRTFTLLSFLHVLFFFLAAARLIFETRFFPSAPNAYRSLCALSIWEDLASRSRHIVLEFAAVTLVVDEVVTLLWRNLRS